MATNDQHESKGHKDTGYTPGESKFADGKDTKLNTETNNVAFRIKDMDKFSGVFYHRFIWLAHR